MDINKLLRGVKSLNDYLSVTQDLLHKYKKLNIQFNMSTVLSLKNVKSLEIEYFNKCDDSGAAFLLFERILSLPPSKTWNLLGKELVNLLQYWLDAVRKHLISHHLRWWTFLRHLLNFIKGIRQKDSALNNTLTSEVSECLLDLASDQRLNVYQRFEVLHTFNLFCAESSREIRMSLRPQFEHYFIKLSAVMASCGHMPSQYSTMESLLRWLQPRRDQAVRARASAAWFPGRLFARAAVDIFLGRAWLDFFQDTRDFLNEHNRETNLVTPVMCRKLSVGQVDVISGMESRQTWLDINSGSKCVSMLMDPRLLEVLGAPGRTSCEALTVTRDNAVAVQMNREAVEVTITATTVEPPEVLPSCLDVFKERSVRIVISSRDDLERVDKALRGVFGDKYQVLFDLENITSLSPLPLLPENAKRRNSNMNEEKRFFQLPPDVKRRRQSGYIVMNRKPVEWKSPSTVSTSSLAQLHDKLTALPRCKFDKEPISVLAQPELSSVTEISEINDGETVNSSSSTLKLRPCGVFYKSFKGYVNSKKSQSDGDVKNCEDTVKAEGEGEPKYQSDSEYLKEKVTRTVSADIEDERSNSCLLVATIGSADQSVINATIERLEATKKHVIADNNIVDLLVQEALQAISEGTDRFDSGINTGDGKRTQDLLQKSSDVIENTPYIASKKITPSVQPKTFQKGNFTVVSKSTSNESNTEAIDDTPISYVNVRRKNLQRKNNNKSEMDEEIVKEQNEASTYQTSLKEVEDFFSQHISENRAADVVLSPTLVRKINETSSDISEEFDQYIVAADDDLSNIEESGIHDVDIIECLNNMVDKVCNDLDKCTEYLSRGSRRETLNMGKNIYYNYDGESGYSHPQKIGNNKNKADTKKGDTAISKELETKPKRGIKLTYKTAPKKQKAMPSKNKLRLEPATKMSPIIEVNNEIVEEPITKVSISKHSKKDLIDSKVSEKTPLTRRKRKLYSPKSDHVITEKSKDDDIVIEKTNYTSEVEEDVPLSKLQRTSKPVTPSATATCYKDIENDRKKNKKLRTRKSRNMIASPPSPQTVKLNEVFDKLKDNIESCEKIIIADKKTADKDLAIYNFTTDSEDEDFKKKKLEIKNRTSTTTIESGNSIMSVRRRGKTSEVNTTKDTKKIVDEPKKTSAKRKKPVKRQNPKKTQIEIDPPVNLIDERMREDVTETLETSLILDNPAKEIIEDPEPITIAPEIELITDDIIEPKDKKKLETNTEKTVSTDEKKTGAITNTEKIKPAKKTKKAHPVKKGIEKLQLKEKDIDDRTVSPLPGLLVETEQLEQNMDDSLTTNMVQKFKKIYQDGPDVVNDTNTTQNLLSDNERNDSPLMNITEELRKVVEESSRDNSLAGDFFSFNTKKRNFEQASNIKKVEKSVIEANRPDVSKEDSSKKKRRLKLLTIKKEVSNIEKVRCTPMTTIDDIVTNLSTGNLKKKLRRDELHSSINTSNTTSGTKKSSNNDVIIIIDEPSIARNKPNTRPKAQNTRKDEISNISDETPIESDKSIATDGITAHGDSHELPPSPENLHTNVIPRELVDMDECIKEYYVKLREELNDRQDTSNSSMEETDVCRKKKTDLSRKKSPVVRLERLSSEEVSKWTPTKSGKEVNKCQGTSRIDSSKEDTFRRKQSDTSRNKETSPVVFLKRMSIEEFIQCTPSKINENTIARDNEDDYKKWLPSLKDSDSDASEPVKNVSPVIVTRSSLKRSLKESYGKSHKKKTLSPQKNIADTKVTQKKLVKPKSPEKVTRKSLISPIVFFEDSVNFNARKDRSDDIALHDSPKSSNSKSKIEEKKPKSPFAKPQTNKYYFRKYAMENKENLKESSQTEYSRSLTEPKQRNQNEVVAKKQKVLAKREEEVVEISESGPSVSSVDDWFRRNEPVGSRAKSLDVPVRDTIQNVMEKLDTTLVEIHQNTSKLFINLFVDTQQQLHKFKETKRELKRQTATNLLQGLARLIDAEFTELDTRFQDIEDQFMETLRRRAAEFLREDCKKKRAMVDMLREDVQTVLDNLEQHK